MNQADNKPIFLIGSGGHASVLEEIISLTDKKLIGISLSFPIKFNAFSPSKSTKAIRDISNSFSMPKSDPGNIAKPISFKILWHKLFPSSPKLSFLREGT